MQNSCSKVSSNIKNLTPDVKKIYLWENFSWHYRFDSWCSLHRLWHFQLYVLTFTYIFLFLCLYSETVGNCCCTFTVSKNVSYEKENGTKYTLAYLVCNTIKESGKWTRARKYKNGERGRIFILLRTIFYAVIKNLHFWRQQ